MSKNKDKIQLPSVLAFERKLEVSDGLMFAGVFTDIGKNKNKNGDKLWQKIKITPRNNLSTQSSYANKDIDKTRPNPVSSGGDMAVIPSDCDTLRVRWTMRIIGNIGKPTACKNQDFEDALIKKTEDFDFTELAYRYAYNIANGRFLWRNRVCAEEVVINVCINNQDSMNFTAYDFSLQDFEKNKDDEDLNKLAAIIKKGLEDKTGENFTSIKINAFVKLDETQQVFPSQEMNTGEKKKVLFKLNDCAAMHNVKIGNAIRTIDTWYGDKAIKQNAKGDQVESIDVITKIPISIEPYGSLTQRGMAYRPSKNDLYTLMLGWVNENELSSKSRNYVIANLIRGGVFGGKD